VAWHRQISYPRWSRRGQQDEERVERTNSSKADRMLRFGGRRRVRRRETASGRRDTSFGVVTARVAEEVGGRVGGVAVPPRRGEDDGWVS
jgi:hypothetical protein